MKVVDDKSFTSRDSGIWALIALACYVVVRFGLGLLGGQEISQLSALFVAVTVFAIRTRWDLKNEPWFWLGMLAISIAQGLIAFYVPWPKSSYPVILIMAPIVFIDFFAIFVFIILLEKVFDTSTNDS